MFLFWDQMQLPLQLYIELEKYSELMAVTLQFVYC